MKLNNAERGWVKKCGQIAESQSRQSGEPMGLRSAYPRGDALKRGGVRSVE